MGGRGGGGFCGEVLGAKQGVGRGRVEGVGVGRGGVGRGVEGG